jgi:hypothetical protein
MARSGQPVKVALMASPAPQATAAGAPQISRFGITPGDHVGDQVADHIGGSARGYRELSTPIAIPVTVGWAGRPGRMFMHRQRWM